MKFTAAFLILTLYCSVFPQDGWFWQKPLPQGNPLTDVWAFGKQRALAVGYYGTIVLSEDGGETFSTVRSGTTARLNKVFFIDGTTGWIAGNFDGEDAVILKTDNRGRTWVRQSAGYKKNLYSIFFTDALNGFASGSDTAIIKTTDGGTTWIHSDIGLTRPSYAIFFLDSTTGWAGQDWSTILKTENGGDSWSEVPLPFLYSVRDIFFLNSNAGWITGSATGIAGKSGFALATADGGASWQSMSYEKGSETNSPVFFGDGSGWMVDRRPLRTYDGGSTWEQLSGSIDSFCCSPGQTSASAGHFRDAATGWVSGGQGLFIRTIDSGRTWNGSPADNSPSFRAIFFLDGLTGWAAGSQGAVFKSNDGGTSWDSLPHSTANIFDITFKTPLLGWAAGSDPESQHGLVMITHDGGESWVSVILDASSAINSIYFLDTLLGWAAGFNGALLKTENGGLNWTQQSIGSTAQLQSVQFMNAGLGWAAGNGTILKTADSGATWQSADVPQKMIWDIHFIGKSRGWAVGDSGLVLYSEDGGSSWAVQPTGEGNDLHAVTFADRYSGWAVGVSGTILRTENGGNTWIIEPERMYRTLEDIHFVDENTGWITGSEGTILKTLNGGISGIRNPSPASLKHQPIPLPSGLVINRGQARHIFNDNVLSATEILIYTVQGQLVRSLKPVHGSFSWDFLNSRNQRLPPGLYLYQAFSRP